MTKRLSVLLYVWSVWLLPRGNCWLSTLPRWGFHPSTDYSLKSWIRRSFWDPSNSDAPAGHVWPIGRRHPFLPQLLSTQPAPSPPFCWFWNQTLRCVLESCPQFWISKCSVASLPPRVPPGPPRPSARTGTGRTVRSQLWPRLLRAGRRSRRARGNGKRDLAATAANEQRRCESGTESSQWDASAGGGKTARGARVFVALTGLRRRQTPCSARQRGRPAPRTDGCW